MGDLALMARVVRETLARFPLRHAYSSEQSDLQPHIQAELDKALREAVPDARVRVTISVGGTGKSSLKLLGTSFWPDVEVSDDGTRLIAIEVKLIRREHRPSAAIAQALGQAIIYSFAYPKVFTFVVHSGPYDDRCDEYDSELHTRLLPLNIEVVVRRLGNESDA